MARGRNSPPTPLPDGFSSWRDLYEKWDVFRTSKPRSAKPSRAELFAQEHNLPVWLLGTIPYIFRTAERDDAVGAYAREVINKIERNKIGVPKANNEIRAFAQQNPRFREASVQIKALDETLRWLRSVGTLTDSIRNFSPDISTEQLEEYFSSLSNAVRHVTRLKNRIAITLEERKEES